MVHLLFKGVYLHTHWSCFWVLTWIINALFCFFAFLDCTYYCQFHLCLIMRILIDYSAYYGCLCIMQVSDESRKVGVWLVSNTSLVRSDLYSYSFCCSCFLFVDCCFYCLVSDSQSLLLTFARRHFLLHNSDNTGLSRPTHCTEVFQHLCFSQWCGSSKTHIPQRSIRTFIPYLMKWAMGNPWHLRFSVQVKLPSWPSFFWNSRNGQAEVANSFGGFGVSCVYVSKY